MRLFPFCLTRYGISLCVLLTASCKAETQGETPTPAPSSNSQLGNRHDTHGNSSEERHPVRFEPESVTVPLKFNPQVSDAADIKVTLKTETGQSAPVVIPVQIQPSVGSIAAIKIPVVLQIQAEQATPLTGLSLAPPKDADDHIGGISSGDLLTLIVALAAYIAAVRLFLKERLGDLEVDGNTNTQSNKAERKQELKDAIARLALADLLFVVAALFLCWRLFIRAEPRPAPWLISSTFTAAIIYLAYLHSREWVRHPRMKRFRNWLKKKRS